MQYTAYIKTLIPALSQIRAVASQNGLCRIIFDTQDDFKSITHEIIKDDFSIFIELKKQLDLYAQKKLTQFTVPLDIQGTQYQKVIWEFLQTIAYGETVSYKNISDMAVKNKVKSCSQSVGGANSKNPLPLLIPCHRVINHNGTIGGYSGTTELKQALLALERLERF